MCDIMIKAVTVHLIHYAFLNLKKCIASELLCGCSCPLEYH